MKKVINKSTSEYTVFLENVSYKLQPQNFGIFENEVANEFKKYYPTILLVEDYVELEVPEVPKTQEVQDVLEVPKVLEVKDEPVKKVKIEKKSKVVKEVIKKISTETSKKKGRPKKSKK